MPSCRFSTSTSPSTFLPDSLRVEHFTNFSSSPTHDALRASSLTSYSVVILAQYPENGRETSTAGGEEPSGRAGQLALEYVPAHCIYRIAPPRLTIARRRDPCRATATGPDEPRCEAWCRRRDQRVQSGEPGHFRLCASAGTPAQGPERLGHLHAEECDLVPGIVLLDGMLMESTHVMTNSRID